MELYMKTISRVFAIAAGRNSAARRLSRFGRGTAGGSESIKAIVDRIAFSVSPSGMQKTESRGPYVPARERVRLTLADVAAALGISRTSVSNAFNRPEQLSKELRSQILVKSKELGYFGPDAKARALRRHEIREVAVVFHHDLPYAFNDALSLDFMRGVARQLHLRGLTLQLIPKFVRQIE